MSFIVDERPRHLLELLFLRAAWNLETDEHFPELLLAVDRVESEIPESEGREEWSRRWSQAWRRGTEWYESPSDATTIDPALIRSLNTPGAPRHSQHPPKWSAEWGDEGIDQERMEHWVNRVSRPTPLVPTSPEYLVVEALEAAWNRGLRGVVVLPFIGEWQTVLSPSRLGLSPNIRLDRDLYVRALASYPAAA
ncbi:hypothetical protein C5C24_06545 [Rathayibacter sp. AY2B3]|nr:hypothetical protein [Rathayibacter sp. AY2B3]PPG51714.1 hypothetical protein C5C24_06545 [Rathayibacter sp. AY2B3]PPI27323.1 hypothetical protein C5D44_04675 [Rathayibacter sp. AY1B5]